MLGDWKFCKGFDALQGQGARHAAQMPAAAKFCASGRLSRLRLRCPGRSGSSIVCPPRLPFSCGWGPCRVRERRVAPVWSEHRRGRWQVCCEKVVVEKSQSVLLGRSL